MRPRATVSADAEAVLDALADYIDVLLEAQFDEMAEGHQWVPTSTSPLKRVQSRMLDEHGPNGQWDGRDAEQAGRIATLMLYVSGQHLDGIRVLLRSRDFLFPLKPLARAVLESTGRAFWLVSPEIEDARDSAARLWMAYLEEATRRVTTSKLLHTQAEIERRLEAKRKLRDELLPARFHPDEIANVDGRITLRGQHLPPLSQSMKYIASAMGTDDSHTALYSYLSDASHPTAYPALELATPTGVGGLNRFGAPDMNLEYLIMRDAVIAFQQAWILATAYFGHPIVEAERVCDQLDQLPKPNGWDQ